MEHLELDTGLSDKAMTIRETAMEFAVEIMRPAGMELDSLADPQYVIAEASKLWEVIKAHRQRGFHRIAVRADLAGVKDEIEPMARPLLIEALGYGDAGLAIALSTDSMPFEIAALSSEKELRDLARAYCADTAGGLIGCWIDLQSESSGNRRVIGNEYAIQRYKTGWITNGSIATHALVKMASMGNEKPLVAVIPLDLPGVSRGDPLGKMGLRALNQCEIILEQVKIPEKCFIKLDSIAEKILSSAHSAIGQIAVGLAQASLDESVAYANDRIQGGIPIIKHNNIKLKLFNMFAMIESSRAFARSVALYNQADQSSASAKHSIALRAIASETAFKATSEAIQIFGGNGLIKAYPVEKMMRDAGLLMNINGTNEALALEVQGNLY